MEWAPGDNFINIEESAQFKNDNFDSSYGTSYVPLKSLYENKKFSEIKDDLKELHREIHSILKDANSKMENRNMVLLMKTVVMTILLEEKLLCQKNVKNQDCLKQDLTGTR